MSTLESIHRKNNAIIEIRNGVNIPISYNNFEKAYHAVRKNIVLMDYSHFGIIKISGESSHELLNLILAGDIASIRDEQAMYTIVLDENSKIITDIYVLCDGDDFILLSEWLSGEKLCDLFHQFYETQKDNFDDDIIITNLNSEKGIIHFEGPYSWELLAEFHGMDVIGLPFQEFMYIDDESILFRSGKHGEYSYKIIAPFEKLVEYWQQAVEEGQKYKLVVGGLEIQKRIRLENPCWQPAVFNNFTQCPIELQLQWTVRYDKDDFQGKEKLFNQLEEGVSLRAVGFSTQSEQAEHIQVNDPVYLNDQPIGKVITVGYSPDLSSYLGRLILNADNAYADIHGYTVQTEKGSVPITTAGIPFYPNYSFLISPIEHSYVDPNKPSNLLEQLEQQKEKELLKQRETLAQQQAQWQKQLQQLDEQLSSPTPDMPVDELKQKKSQLTQQIEELEPKKQQLEKAFTVLAEQKEERLVRFKAFD